MAFPIEAPFQYFTDGDGNAIEGGFIWFGVVNQDPQSVPLAMYWDDALTIAAAQPIRTLGGYPVRNGTPARVYPSGPYSLRVQDQNGVTLYTVPDATDPANYMLRNGASVVNYTPINTTASRDVAGRLNEGASAVDQFTAAEVTDVETFTGAINVTTHLQARIDSAWAAARNLDIPAGYYTTTGLTIPADQAFRTRHFALRGQGSGEIFARGFTGGTIIRSVTDAPILLFENLQSGYPNAGPGTLEITGLRLEGNSATAPVVRLRAFLGQSEFHHNAVFQAGDGDGVRTQFSNTVEIHHNYVINGDWNTSVLGNARTGIGFHITNALDAGLTTLRKNTSRGFLWAYKFGDGSPTGRLYTPHLRDSEVSVSTNGVWLTSSVQGGSVDGCYLEGGDGGTAVLDEGSYNTVANNLVFPGFSVGIDGSAPTYGSYYSGNTLSAGSRANTTLMKVNSSGINGGPGKVVSGNTFTFSGSGGTIAGVVGLEISGIDPRLTWNDNVFDPRGPWVGGAGTKKISNISTSSDGTTGTGVYGMGIAQDLAEQVEAPHLGRGAINLKVDETALSEANVASNVLTIGELSVFTMTATVPTAVNRIVAPNLPDKTFQIHLTNNQTTLQQGTYLKLMSSTNFTPGANGSWHTFQIKPTGIAYETARVLY